MDTNNLIDKITKTSIAVVGAGVAVTAIGAMDLRMQYESGYINPLVKAGWTIMSAGAIPMFLTGCGIMCNEIYNDIRGVTK